MGPGARCLTALFACIVAYACGGSASSRPVVGDGGSNDAGPEGGAPDGGRDAGRSGCSSGPPHQLMDKYPFEPEPASLPQRCVPRCEYSHGSRESLPSGMLYLDALPSGACEVEGEECSLPVRTQCACGSLGPVWMMRCACNGAWACAILGAPGAAACSCPQDAGSD